MDTRSAHTELAYMVMCFIPSTKLLYAGPG